MNRKRILERALVFVTWLILIASATACSPEETGPRVWIDFPLDGASVPANAATSVVAHTYTPAGIAEVMLLVNGAVYRRDPPAQPGNSFSQSTHEWFPQTAGTYTLQVRAFSKDGTSIDSKTITVQAIGKTIASPTPTGVAPRVISPSPTPVPLPDLAIVNVEAIVAGDKDGVPFCNTRVTYRNAGAVAVPRDFVIQFHFDGTPQLANTIAGGLAPGATAQATFVYQFTDQHYIGINLDSTSLITESNETNNAFAEARRCGTLPSPITPTGVITPTVTRTPTIPPSAGCSGTPSISSFTASPSSIIAGQSATLSWGAVTNADSVSIEPGIGGIATPGTRVVSPTTTTTYVLTARCGNSVATRQTTINVTAPTPTRTPTKPQDTQGPPAPQLVSPSGTLSCRSNVTLDWNPVTDPSGIKTYYVKLERQITQGNWQSAGGWTTSGTSQSVPVQCGGIYRWQVRAEDGAGNMGSWSGLMNFSINLN